VEKEYLSKAFDILKIAAIFIVFFVHFVQSVNKETLLYVLGNFGLFTFGFSSAYFISLKYKGTFDLKKYFLNKITRLWPKITIVFLFLGIYFYFTGEPNIISFHSLIQYLGLGGFLNWFFITDESPFGVGMWFITLLLLFYAAYPLINMLKTKKAIILFTATFILLMFSLSISIQYGHSLFLTACAFIIGFFFERMKIKLEKGSVIRTGVFFLVLSIIYLAFNLILGIKSLNFFFQLALFVPALLLALRIPIIFKILRPLSYVSCCLLEFYLVHSYFIKHFTNNFILDLTLSFILTLTIAYGLNYTLRVITSTLKNKKK
jgi:hypothetical protein